MKRIDKIVSALPTCHTLADVGCDHGYIGFQALTNGKCQTAYFIDVSMPSLQKAKVLCQDNSLGNTVFLCQDGLQNVKCDVAVIAGMGGLEIISILSNAKSLPQTLVLQPMRSVSELRLFVAQSYKIVSDEKFCDGKYYDLIVAVKCDQGDLLTQDELTFGRSNLVAPTPDFINFIEQEQTKLTDILKTCNDEEVQRRLANVERVSELIRRNKQ